MSVYMNTLKKILKIDAGVEISVFVFEKTTVNCKTDLTKDGIHMNNNFEAKFFFCNI